MGKIWYSIILSSQMGKLYKQVSLYIYSYSRRQYSFMKFPVTKVTSSTEIHYCCVQFQITLLGTVMSEWNCIQNATLHNAINDEKIFVRVYTFTNVSIHMKLLTNLEMLYPWK
jgi:hypothetical protein